ncbi:MAG TPA: trigger factor [Eubacteriales bacterium]|nr:trigger factor [Clostridia bacterium]HRV72392.1 trigger factor [Eubacteriales bacterium]
MATFEKIEGNKAKLTIVVDQPAFEQAIETAYHKTASRYAVPGFRKGKAPRRIIENAYGAGVFYEDAFEIVWGDAYDKALEEHSLTAVDHPEVDIVNISEAEGVTFTAEVQLLPEVTLGQYKGIEFEKPEYTVSDEEVDAALEAERKEHSRVINVERPVENGDTIVLDYSGSIDGVKFDGGTAEDQDLTIGSGSFIPGFEEQLVGAVEGEERDISVTFPDDYHAEELAGKVAVFSCKIKAVRKEELPQVNDDFITDISEFNTVDEWKADKRNKLMAEREEQSKNAYENGVLSKACENAQCDIPDCMINRQLDSIMREMEVSMKRSGFTLEMYCTYLGTTPDEIRKQRRPEAETRIKMELVLDAIVKAENIEVSDEEAENMISEMATKYSMSVDELKKSMQPSDVEYVKDNVRTRKAIAVILDSSVQK